MSEQELNNLLTEWLKEHNAGLLVMAQGPRGGRIEASEFLPDHRWLLSVIVVAQKDQQAQGTQRQS